MSLLKIKPTSAVSKKNEELLNMVKGKKDTMRLNANIPYEIYIDLKTIAAKENKKITDIVISSILNYIKNSITK